VVHITYKEVKVKIKYLFFGLWLLTTAVCNAQKVPASFKNALADYIQQYQFGFNGKAETVRILDIKADAAQKELHINL